MPTRYDPRDRLLGAGMYGRVSQWMRRQLVKSVQRGFITITGATTNTGTITAVDPNNSVLVYLGVSASTATADAQRAFTRIDLTNSTTVTATTAAATDVTTVGFEVIEYFPGVLRSVQRGTIPLTGVAMNTATLTSSVVVGASNLTTLGWTTTNTTGAPNNDFVVIDLTNTTTVTANRSNNSNNCVVGYQVAEWF